MSETGEIRLAPLSDNDLEIYREAVAERLRRSYIQFQAMAPDEAARLAQKRVAALFQAASEPPRATCILAIKSGAKTCGTLAYAINADDGHVFLWDIHIDENHRRRGHGRAAMLCLEAAARGAAVHSLRLNVEAGNTVSDMFFRSLGYSPASITMIKSV